MQVQKRNIEENINFGKRESAKIDCEFSDIEKIIVEKEDKAKQLLK